MNDWALESTPQILGGNLSGNEMAYLSKSALTKAYFKVKKNIFSIKFPNTKVISITISPSLKFLAAVLDYKVQIIIITKSINEWSTPVNQITFPNSYFSNDEKFLVTGSPSDLIQVWLFKEKILCFNIELSKIPRNKSIILSCSIKKLAIISPQTTLNIWDLYNKVIIETKKSRSFDALCFSNCGQLLAFANSSGLISIANFKDFHSEISIENTKKIVSIAFSPNSKNIAFKQEFSYIIVWDIEFNREIYRINEEMDDCMILDFSKNANFLFGISKETIYILRQLKNIDSCKYRKFDRKSYSDKKMIYCGRLHFLIANYEDEYNIYDLKKARYECYVVKDKIEILAFSPDDQWLAIVHCQEITIQNLRESNRRIFVREFLTFIKYVCFSYDSNMIAYGCGIRFEVFNLLTGNLVISISNCSDSNTNINFSSENNDFLIGTKDGITIYKLSGSKITLRRKSIYPWYVQSCMLAIGLDKYSIEIWDLIQDHVTHSIPFKLSNPKEIYLINDNLFVKLERSVLKISISTHKWMKLIEFEDTFFSNDRKLIIYHEYNRYLNIYDTENDQFIIRKLVASDFMKNCIFTVSSKFFARSNENEVYVIDIDAFLDSKDFNNLSWMDKSIYIANNKAISAKILQSDSIKITNHLNKNLSFELPISSKNFICLTYSHDGRFLATNSSSKTIQVWDLQTKTKVFELNGHNESIISIKFSFNCKILASGSWDSTIKLWNLNEKRLKLDLYGHSNGIHAISFDRLDKHIASASFDGTIKIWNIEENKLRYSFDEERVRGLCFTKGSKFLVLKYKYKVKVLMIGVIQRK